VARRPLDLKVGAHVNPVPFVLSVWLLAALMMIGGWLWQRRHHNAGIVDVLWASGLGASAVFAALCGAGAPSVRLLTGVCGATWGVRLARHLWKRVRAEPEDGRYRALRARWGSAQAKWFGLFQFQAGLVALFCIPFMVAAGNYTVRPAWLLAAAAIFILSIAGEDIADGQLARFRADPANRGRTCQSGLWRYSRHPNYFFEWLHWFTYVAIAAGAPHAAWSLLGPATMYLFLRWVSGIPFTEAQALRTRGDDYRDYQRRTSILFPWPPKRPLKIHAED
jgi:steroid 5-alpha reductase family enzyme